MAQVKDFYIPTINSASELLDLLLNPTAMAERLKSLTDFQDAINTRLKRWEEFDSIDAYRAKAEAFMVEAQKRKEFVGKLAAESEKKASDILEKAKSKIAATEAKLDVRAKVLDEQQGAVDKKAHEAKRIEDESIARNAQAHADLVTAQTMRDNAQKLMADAQQIKVEYLAKLDKMKGLVE